METNPKILQTEIRIQQAFINIVTRRGFDKLNIRELTEVAQINRGTFYLHYLDKYDLLHHYEEECLLAIHDIFQRYPKPLLLKDSLPLKTENSAFFQLFKYLYRQRDLARLLLNIPNSKFTSDVKKLILEVLSRSQNQPTPSDIDFNANFAGEMVSQGILDMIRYWLDQKSVLEPKAINQLFVDSRRLTPEQLTQTLK